MVEEEELKKHRKTISEIHGSCYKQPFPKKNETWVPSSLIDEAKQEFPLGTSKAQINLMSSLEIACLEWFLKWFGETEK